MAESNSENLRLDALRGIAAVSVALYHVRSELWVGWAGIRADPGAFSLTDRTLSWLGVPMRFMGAGVLLFFVISGYCIHRPQAADVGAHGPGWSRFLIRRTLRIYPPYLVALLLSGLVLAWAQGWTRAGDNRLLASLPMLQNYWPPRGQLPTNPSLWSLPVEMELYLVYPLAWWLGRRLGWNLALACAITISLAAQYLSWNGAHWLDASFPRFWALWCAGAWLAERSSRKPFPRWDWRWCVGLAALLVAAVVSDQMAPVRGLSLWLWGLASMLALIWATGRSATHGSNWVTVAAWIGMFSYSLYLIHYPLFHLAGEAWRRGFGAKPSSLAVPLAGVLVAIAVARLFHRCIEAPSHRLARRAGRSGA
jgi:peptidoglycan/LPS O-acetylase OafA/YrhL